MKIFDIILVLLLIGVAYVLIYEKPEQVEYQKAWIDLDQWLLEQQGPPAYEKWMEDNNLCWSLPVDKYKR